MQFKDTKYGDLSGQDYREDINIVGLDVDDWEGAPKTFWGIFNAHGCKFKNLKGAPLFKEGSSVYFDNNPLETLEDMKHEETLSDFGIAGTHIKSFKGCPKKIIGMFAAYNNKGVTTMEGAPTYVAGRYFVRDCNIAKWGNHQPSDTTPIMVDFSGNPNIHLELEFNIRKKNQHLSEQELNLMLFKTTNDTIYLSKELKDMFIF